MAEETKPAAAAAASEEVVVVPDVPEKELPAEPVAEPEKPAEPVAEADTDAEAKPTAEQEKITESTSFKEETNVVGELPDPQKVALDELKALVQEALNKHEFTAFPPPPPAEPKEEEKPAEPTTEEKPAEPSAAATAAAEETPKTEEKTPEPEAPAPASEEPEAVVATPPPAAEEPAAPEVVVEVVDKVETTVVDKDGAKTVEAIEETVVAVAAAPVTEESAAAAAAPAEPETETAAAVVVPPEEVSIWGIPLLADSRSDVVLLKFLRARDFKVKEAFAMLKSVVAWRKEFKIESLLDEDFGTEQDKVVYLHGCDKEGHPVCYNAFGEYQNKELYQNTFADEEKRTKFLRWRIQFLEKSIRKLDFSPDGINSFVQINDLKNSPGFFQRELRLATNQALQLLQDNYPEFVAKQV